MSLHGPLASAGRQFALQSIHVESIVDHSGGPCRHLAGRCGHRIPGRHHSRRTRRRNRIRRVRRREAEGVAPRPVTPPLDDSARVLNAFRALVKQLRTLDRIAVERYGLGSAQIYVLHCLSVAEPLSVGKVATMTATDQSTVSLVVAKLVERGLVDSRRAIADARRSELTLSRKGRALARKLPLVFQDQFIRALEQLEKPTLKGVADALEAVARAMGIEEEHPSMLLSDAASGRETKRPPKGLPRKKHP